MTEQSSLLKQIFPELFFGNFFFEASRAFAQLEKKYGS
jgi:hypothetical protein